MRDAQVTIAIRYGSTIHSLLYAQAAGSASQASFAARPQNLILPSMLFGTNHAQTIGTLPIVATQGSLLNLGIVIFFSERDFQFGLQTASADTFGVVCANSSKQPSN